MTEKERGSRGPGGQDAPNGGLIGELLDDNASFSLWEVCERYGVHAEYVMDMVSYGVVEPQSGIAPLDWRFDCRALLRIGKAIRLGHDLNLDLPGLAISLDLLDEVEQLRHQVRDLHNRLRRLQPEE